MFKSGLYYAHSFFLLGQGPVSQCGVFRVPKNGALGNKFWNATR